MKVKIRKTKESDWESAIFTWRNKKTKEKKKFNYLGFFDRLYTGEAVEEIEKGIYLIYLPGNMPSTEIKEFLCNFILRGFEVALACH